MKLDRVEYGLKAHQPQRLSRADWQGMLLAVLAYSGGAALWALGQLMQGRLG